LERVVAAVWGELFQIDQVGMDDNFFDLGGHSVLLVQAHARLRERLGRDVSIVALLRYPTVRSLARYLGEGEGSNAALDAVRAQAQRQRQALAKRRGPRGRG
jgi:aryl carrier-like protein